LVCARPEVLADCAKLNDVNWIRVSSSNRRTCLLSYARTLVATAETPSNLRADLPSLKSVASRRSSLLELT
jgi:hypothetical protein